ncbi:MAG TPA: hypothetical protein PK325_01335 [Cyclobacteriaceae bacterium]|nr:hypothetical protein [Cyclobacteriaceae bacterium]HMV08088.1 hypothetical protein [Cyclobacteriaceae bacterium]HMX00729.1 hypothetical protein [Cyclobacteriaceae bacterium]HMX49396.1 hypothetical protein [Cyclobacteriaceae bacterium]HMY93532.1 hypothetical protein [Cyclobacteriaceae bacterium]
MKIRALVFTLYLLALALYPCSDAETCADDSDSRAKVELASHDHSQDESDQCTPFCICACCSATIRLTVSEVLLPATFHNTTHTIPYAEGHLLSNIHAIWQPPRLS